MSPWIFSAFWWLVAGWVAIEAARRKRSWFLWACLVELTTLLGLVIWLFVRRRSADGSHDLGRGRTVLIGLAGVPIGVLILIVSTWTVTFVGQVARIEGQAMAPTLETQDRVLVNHLAYRVAPPARGDVVMLRYPLNPDKLFVKRVVAIESDRLRIQDGRVLVNEVPGADTEVAPDSRSHDDWGRRSSPRATVS